jgi:hypothetical protein
LRRGNSFRHSLYHSLLDIVYMYTI